MSPAERHNPKLRNLQLGGEGPKGPDEADDVIERVEDELDAGIEPDAEELDEALDEEEVEEYEEMEERAAELKSAKTAHVKHPGPISRLYNGETSFDFVGRKKWWFLASSIIIVVGLVSLGVRGLNLGIDFKGGQAWIVKPAPGLTQTQVQNAVESAGLTQPTVEFLGSGSNQSVEVQGDINNLSAADQLKVTNDVKASLEKLIPQGSVSFTSVGPTWGSQVTQRALIALLVFFVVVAVYISFRFEPKMAIAAFVAMIHDLLITIGVYSLAGFQVTPDTVIAILTILGYSLYDTVVVFDRVRDNTKGFGASGRMTYSEMINLSMNQTLARSINTSLVAILPVLAVLVVGAEILGATTLQDYGLALTVGLLSGAYSSIFIAAPVLAVLKEREPRYATIRQRLETRGERTGILTPAAAAAMGGAAAARSTGSKGTKTASGAIRPGAAKTAPRQKVGASAGSGTRSTGTAGSGANGTSGSGPRRPPPRPRKGSKSKGKKKR